MKKYLMTGIAAVAMCAAFTSCSHDVDPISQEQLDQLEAEKVFQNYEKAFIATFGQPAANQDWGFGGSAFTRTADPRGNMWASEGWNVPPVISKEQKDIVRRYFQQNTPLGYKDPEWSNFWIQQVYKGGSKTTDGSQTTEKYTIGNSSEVTGGDHMDHLCSKSESGVEDHVNDFNNSDNNDWEGRMLMVSSSTYSFGYINSNATAIHYDKAALVNWRVIAQWAVDNGLESSVETSVLNDGWNRSYMGFDWEQALPDDCYRVNIQTTGGWTSPENYKEGVEYYNGFEVVSKTYSTFEFEGQTYRFLSANSNQYAYDQNEPTYHGIKNITNDADLTDALIRDLLSKGYLPYSDTKKDWIKLSTGADGYYSDWIVTLTEATKGENPYPNATSLRVMAEDLSANEASDFDFNDVVLDFVASADGKSATIYLQAAGGTLPLRINENDAWEVHKLFGVATNVMVNTGATAKGLNGEENKPTVTVGTVTGDYSAEKFCESVNKVKIEVQKNGRWMELTAKKGEACCKFACVPAYEYKWVPELENIDGYYTFSDWVKGFTTKLTKKINW